VASKRHRLVSARKTAGFSQERLAEAVGVERSTVMRWERGETTPQPWVRPKLAHALGISGQALSELLGESAEPEGAAASPAVLCEALSRRLGRTVTLDDLELTVQLLSLPAALDWRADTLIALTDLGKVDDDMERRRVLAAAAYSVAALAVPDEPWWTQMATLGTARATASARSVGRGDLETVREMASLFSRVDQRRGGGHARMALVQYLTSDVATYLRGSYIDERVRKDMFSVASELAYLSGWMAFDNAEHCIAQHYFSIAVKLAAEADDPPMAGHVLRAMAHQAVDLGHVRQGLELATASMDTKRYRMACPRERALFGVVYARTLGAAGQKSAAAEALITAEDDLACATAGDDEPSRVFFFGEASLVHSARARQTVVDMRAALSAFRRSGVPATVELDARACAYLNTGSP